MKPLAKGDRLVAVVMLAVASLYLVPFVGRGWFPHDEGMIGQSAERVLRGEIPHVDYEEPYTGGLTLLHAVIFKVLGPDLVNIRWSLLVAAVLTLFVLYVVLRRYLSPVAAALGTWVSVGWSFPNYFASLPSWWLLISAILSLAALIRFIETDRLRYVALASLAVGIAMVVKQTGVYLVVPLAMTLLLRSGGACSRVGFSHGLAPTARVVLGLGSLAFSIWVMRQRLGLSEIVYLVTPIAASSLTLIFWNRIPSPNSPRFVRVATLACAVILLPLALFMVPYVSGGYLRDFVRGALLLPQLRLTFASLSLPPAPLILCGPLLFVAFVPVPKSLTKREGQVLRLARWGAAAVLLALSIRHDSAYMFVWQSSRSIASLLPVVSFWLIVSARQPAGGSTDVLFAASSMLAWASLVQFPFGAPIYFCYIAPLAVITIVTIVKTYELVPLRELGALSCLLLAFAVVSMNRSYTGILGTTHRPVALDVPLGLEKANLTVSAIDAYTYQRVVALVTQHLGQGSLLAGPDCPEVYFLTDQFSPSGTLFDFFDSADRLVTDPDWLNASVVVINHRPDFSLPLSPQLLGRIRRVLRNGESIGPFEVRWQ